MKWLRRDTLVALLGLSAIMGVTAAGVSLYRALVAVRLLVAIETDGMNAVSGIRSEVLLSRNSFRLILASQDATTLEAASTEGHSVDARIAAALQTLESFEFSGVMAAKMGELRDRWQSLLEIRERAISLSRNGKLAEMRELDVGSFDATLEGVIASLQALHQAFSEFATQQQEIVRVGLRNAVAELAALASTTILFVATLIWSRRKQQRLLTLQSRSEQLEIDRALILDMAARNEPLLAILQVLVSVTEKQIPGSIACFSVVENGHLRDVVAPGLPRALIESVYPHGAAMRLQGPNDLPKEAVVHGLMDCWSQEILSNQGDQIGRVDIYMDNRTTLCAVKTALLEGVAKLAGVVIQHREMYEQLVFQAMRDPLTGLPNRRLFQDRLEQAILRAHRDKEKVAVLLIDLDRFKQVNDLLGHNIGDALLCGVANRVAGCLRKSDTLSRIGGDEFTVLLNPVENIEGAEQALCRIADVLQEPLTILDQKISVSASIGLSIYPDHCQDPATLLRNADLAMYHAKERGKNGWQTYVPELGAGMLKRMSIEKALERAIECGEFELHYQAQANLEGRLTGVEALLRWHNPQLGQVLPAIFIPVAEESGLIVPIGSWVLEQACSQTATWLEAGFPIDRIAVNVSARQLVQPGFMEGVQAALQRSGLRPNCLELELTETALMYDLESCLRQLQNLRDLGVSVAIDDFGTGYSSLFYLQNLPVSRVKIDQSFVQGITDCSQKTLPLIRAIVDLAHSLGLTVIAEGVETLKQHEALSIVGCDQLQGYLIHKPQTASQIVASFGQLLSDRLPLVCQQ